MNPMESLIGGWLSLPVWACICSLLAIQTACAVLCYAFLAGKAGRRYAAAGARVSPAMVMSVSVLFALLAGFLGSDIAQRVTRAHRATADEARALTMIEALTRGGSGRFADLRNLAANYAKSVISEELPLSGESSESAAVTGLLDNLKREAAAILLEGGAPSGPVIDAALLLGEARGERLIIREENAGFQWFTVIALSLLMIVALGLVHLDNLRGIVATWAIFIVATVITLGMLAIRDNPFSPPIRVSSAPLVEALSGFGDEASAAPPAGGESR